MQADEYNDWLQHPVTEWVMAAMAKAGDAQRDKWAGLAWDGDLSPLLLNEARVRADCYSTLAQSTFEDWKAIYDTEV